MLHVYTRGDEITAAYYVCPHCSKTTGQPVSWRVPENLQVLMRDD